MSIYIDMQSADGALWFIGMQHGVLCRKCVCSQPFWWEKGVEWAEGRLYYGCCHRVSWDITQFAFCTRLSTNLHYHRSAMAAWNAAHIPNCLEL